MAQEIVYKTSSGTELSANDLREIRKAERKETIRNVLALVGIGALALYVKGYLDTTKSDNPIED